MKYMGVDIVFDEACPKDQVILMPEWMAKKMVATGTIDEKDVNYAAVITDVEV